MANQEKLLEQTELEPVTLVYDVLKNWWAILLGGIAAAMLLCLLTNVRYVPQYTTTATFVVNSRDRNTSYTNLSSANTMATTLEKILESTVMEKKICEVLEIDMEDFDAEIKTEVLEGTNLLELSVTADNPKEAIDVIRTIMDNYTDVSLYAISNAVMDVMQQPSIPYEPDNVLDNISVAKKGFLGGLAVCIFLFGLLSYMKNTVKQEREIEEKLDARSLGAIAYERKYKTLRGFIGKKKSAILIDDQTAGFSFVENFKKLASKVDYQMSKTQAKVLVVTSVSENEGKSTIVANLGIALAQQGKRVILIDGDIRRPSQFLIFGLKPQDKNEFGEFLKGSGNLSDVIMKTTREHLYFIGGRNCYSSSTEMLHSVRLQKTLKACANSADYVIIDTPPAGLIGDSQIFAHFAGAVMLVAKQNLVLAEDINDVIDDFRDNNTRVLGVVLNSVRTFTNNALTGYGAYGYYGNYSHYNHKSRG